MKTNTRRHTTKTKDVDNPINSAIELAKNKVAALDLGRIGRSEYAVPIAVGSFVLGCAVGVGCALLIPKIQDSGVFDDLGGKIDDAKQAVMSGLAKAKDKAESIRADVMGGSDSAETKVSSPRVS